MVNSAVATVLTLFITGLLIIFNTRLYWSRIPLPPGPRPYSFWKGNKFEPNVWYQLLRLKKQWGDIFTLWQGPTPLIILGSVKTAKDILDVRAAETAERPASLIVAMRMTGGLKISTMHVGDLWRKSKHLLHTSTSGEKARSYEPIQARYARILVKDLLENPDEYPILVRKFAASVVARVAFGKQTPTSYEDPEIQRVAQVMQKIGLASKPGQWIVGSYPILRFLPDWMTQGWKTMADAAFKHELTLFRENMADVKQKMSRGEAEPCAMVDCLLEKEKWGMSDDELAYVVGGIFTAGSDTTAIATLNAILAAAVNPEKQKRAQEELRKYCGDRPPVWEDRKNLAYIDAFANEAYRWRTVIPTGVYHCATEDIHYENYVIPKGAVILAPHHVVHRDEAVYENGEDFIPERWLKKKKSEDEPYELNPDVYHYTFGFGRRSCPGNQVAQRSVFINMATMLWSFNIKPKVDPKTGQEIPINPDLYQDALIASPLYFHVNFEPRMPRDKLEKAMEMNLVV